MARIQWHPAFCCAMRLDLKAYSDQLEFKNEYNINTRPLEMDLLIIKKEKGLFIENPVGEMFREHNILEYKSPRDALNIITYYKVMAYACLYYTQEGEKGAFAPEEITISFIRDIRPRGLMKRLEEMGYRLEKKYLGVYRIIGNPFFRAQIIVGNELSDHENTWLAGLTEHPRESTGRELYEKVMSLEGSTEKGYASAVWYVIHQTSEKMKSKDGREKTMYENVMERIVPMLQETRDEYERKLSEQRIQLNDRENRLLERDKEIAALKARLAALGEPVD